MNSQTNNDQQSAPPLPQSQTTEQDVVFYGNDGQASSSLEATQSTSKRRWGWKTYFTILGILNTLVIVVPLLILLWVLNTPTLFFVIILIFIVYWTLVPNIVVSSITIVSIFAYLFLKKPSRKIVFISLVIITFLAADIAILATYHRSFDTLNQKKTQTTKSAQSSDASAEQEEIAQTYTIVDTGQQTCYGEIEAISCPSQTAAYFGQDAQYSGNQPSYTNNNNGTITDNNTGLMWQRDPGEKMTYDDAVQGADGFSLAGYDDWRLPTVKELFSLIQYTGTDPTESSTEDQLTPFIDTNYFDFKYGKVSDGDRVLDSQWATSSVYNSTVMNNQKCFFGVNFADGRIKCYPLTGKKYYVLYVRDNETYGQNSFQDKGNATIFDATTGLTWQQADNGQGTTWSEALDYCENLTLAGHNDWRLPNIKELHSLTDYSKSPDITGSPAIDPIFQTSTITNELGQKDYPFFWSGTTLVRYPDQGAEALYVSFGRAMGNMNGRWMDVHGAGALRSDPKESVPLFQQNGFGPQGDTRRADNYVRCVF